MSRGPRTKPVTPVANRLLVLQAVRVLGAAAVLAVCAIVGELRPSIALGVLCFLGVVGVSELVRLRAPGQRRGCFVSSVVVLDGLALALAVSATGGYRSALLFLVFLEIVAVTLLVSYRAGLKLATWCALLLLLAHAAADAGHRHDASPTVTRSRRGVTAATFLLFAACAAAFSSVNERSLRHSRRQLALLVERRRRARAVAPGRRRDGGARPARVRAARLRARRGDRATRRRVARRRRRRPRRDGRERSPTARRRWCGSAGPMPSPSWCARSTTRCSTPCCRTR